MSEKPVDKLVETAQENSKIVRNTYISTWRWRFPSGSRWNPSPTGNLFTWVFLFDRTETPLFMELARF